MLLRFRSFWGKLISTWQQGEEAPSHGKVRKYIAERNFQGTLFFPGGNWVKTLGHLSVYLHTLELLLQYICISDNCHKTFPWNIRRQIPKPALTEVIEDESLTGVAASRKKFRSGGFRHVCLVPPGGRANTTGALIKSRWGNCNEMISPSPPHQEKLLKNTTLSKQWCTYTQCTLFFSMAFKRRGKTTCWFYLNK